MKSLPIFQIYLNTYKKFHGTLWEYEKPRVNVTQRSPWNSIYVNSLHEKVVGTSLLMLNVDLLMKGDLFS
jgi:hypothetical protein